MKTFFSLIALLLIVVMNVDAQRYSNIGSSGIVLTQIGPDLVVTNVKMDHIPRHLQIYSGNTIKFSVSVTIKNKGNEEARNGFGVYTRLKVKGTKVGARISRLAPGQSKTFKMSVSLPVKYNGKRVNLAAMVDPPGGGKIPESGAPSGGLIREINESNNSRTVSVQLPFFRPVSIKTI